MANYEVIVKWHYQLLKTTQTQLDRNPLGFTVIYYQATPVTLNEGPAV